MSKIIKIYFIGFLLWLFVGGISVFAAFDAAYWKKSQILYRLQNDQVTAVIPMREYLALLGKKVEFSGQVFLVNLASGLKAVFKSFPQEDMGDALAEVAAYQASCVLGFPLIPPTVVRHIHGKQGSLQLYVDTPLDALNPDVYTQAFTQVHPDEVANLKIFYFVFGQWDTGPHNVLIVEQGREKHFVAIDNSGIRNHQHVRYGELPFVRVCYHENFQTDDWGKPFPFDEAKTIVNPTANDLRKVFGTLLSETFYNSFKAYQTPFRYVIYRNSLWRQYHADEEGFVKSYTPYCSLATYKALQKLTLPVLRKIFAHARGADFLTEDYLKAILKRRDEVLKNVKIR